MRDDDSEISLHIADYTVSFDIDDEPDGVADIVVLELNLDQMRVAVRQHVIDRVKDLQRRRVRSLEQRATHTTPYYTRKESEQRKVRWEASHPGEVYEPLSALWTKIGEVTKEIRESVRLELTAELLESTFAVGDGRVVTWGDASISDHRARIEMLKTNIWGNIETMLLHEEAIERLERSHATTLADLKEAA